VNAAYLMLTTAWLAGADPAPAAVAAPPVAGPVVSAPIGGGCGGGCNSGCGCAAETSCCERESKWAKIKAKFKKHSGCGCEESCAAPVQHTCCPAPAPTCCQAAPVSSGCGCEESKGKQLWGKLKGKFKKHGGDCGCESSCNSCGSSSGCGCGGSGGVINGGVISGPTGAPPAEAIPARPAPGAAPMPKPMGSVMGNGVIVTPVVAPRLSADQPF
jgi:hypothetical protein